jgi:hypothetical protein
VELYVADHGFPPCPACMGNGCEKCIGTGCGELTPQNVPPEFHNGECPGTPEMVAARNELAETKKALEEARKELEAMRKLLTPKP